MVNDLRLTIIAIICVVGTALVSGTGVYFWQNSNFSQQSLPITPTPTIKITIQSPSPTIIVTDVPLESPKTQAQTVLENFFTLVYVKDYEKAASLFEWNNPENSDINQWPGSTNAKTLENYCQAVGTCLKVKNAVGKKISDNEYHFTVSFLTDDGKTFALNPPGGITTSSMTSFIFVVKKINGNFKVATPPLFRS